MRTVGEPVDAVAVDIVDQHRKHSADMMCSIRELGGEQRTFEVSQMQNCFGQAKEGDQIVVGEDPLGLLNPWPPYGSGDQDTREITLATAIGLTLVAGASVFYGGRRRRNGSLGWQFPQPLLHSPALGEDLVDHLEGNDLACLAQMSWGEGTLGYHDFTGDATLSGQRRLQSL